jgi:hypothetical protein
MPWSRAVFTRFALVVVITLWSSPALAQGSVQIPEPGDAALFVVAVVGLILGRQASRRAPKRDQAPDDSQV